MQIRRGSGVIQLFFIGLVLAAIVLLAIQLIVFSRSRITYPAGLTVGGVPVGNLTREQAAERLLAAYNLPVELQFEDQRIHLDPAQVGFALNLESMLAAADLARTGGPFWSEFWAYLWGNRGFPEEVPLDATYSEALLRTYLESEIAPRYNRPASSARPQTGTLNFAPGSPGLEIDTDAALVQVGDALRSPARRVVSLPVRRTSPARPSIQNLEIFLKQTLDVSEFDGVAAIYLLDLQTAQEIYFVQNAGQAVPMPPDVAFTASSTIKIPIMISAYRRVDENSGQEAYNLLAGMIEESGNDPADWLMEGYINQFRGPLEVTADMQELGLMNTFLAGYFRPGSPILQFFTTEANSRTDLPTDLDPYNQTTPLELGMLLEDIYHCAQNGGGALVAVFPDEITQDECQQMVEYLSRNFVPFLIPAGTPEGTRIAHKHGWVTDLTGAITTIGDAGIVFTPSGNYVLVIFFHHPVQLVWEPISALIADLARVVYNYYNLPQ
ncbi:MAG: serine hydrolase [Chloroflexi bacterium]|nr:serine hydrolase [Chloroflexota bacterium]